VSEAATDEVIDQVMGYAADPLGFTRAMFPWGTGQLAEHSGPRVWQSEELAAIGEHLSNPATRFEPLRIAVASGHGIGKSAFMGFVSHWGLSTCVNTRIVITANTEGQLNTKTMPELIKWARMAENAAWFKPTATAIYSADSEAEKAWRLDAVPWSINNTEAFAGLHNQGSRIIVLMDEGSAIADKVWEVAEGALTDENTEIIWIVFGNPTRNTGRFRECFRKYRHLWRTRQIDSRTVEGTNKAYLQELVDQYGEDSDIVKVRVRGMFPSMGTKQFIGTDDVDKAQKVHLHEAQYNHAPVILTLDPAFEGDDELVFGKRQGLRFDVLKTMAKNDNDIDVANQLARFEDEHKADAVFVDAGYGTGIVSAGRTMKRAWTLVWFGGASPDAGYLNLRAYMYGQVKEWLKEGGAIDPEDDVLYQDLIGPETVARMDGKIQLESKKEMKLRGLPSPGRGDALALSFAMPVVHKEPPDPLAHLRNRALEASSRRREYNPYARTS
jgi:hypothetical protein